MKDYILVPKDLDRNSLIAEFGSQAIAFYEDRIKQRVREGKVYFNPNKTIYLWAYTDRKTHQGFYTTFRGIANGRKNKNHGGS